MRPLSVIGKSDDTLPFVVALAAAVVAVERAHGDAAVAALRRDDANDVGVAAAPALHGGHLHLVAAAALDAHLAVHVAQVDPLAGRHAPRPVERLGAGL